MPVLQGRLHAGTGSPQPLVTRRPRKTAHMNDLVQGISVIHDISPVAPVTIAQAPYFLRFLPGRRKAAYSDPRTTSADLAKHSNPTPASAAVQGHDISIIFNGLQEDVIVSF